VFQVEDKKIARNDCRGNFLLREAIVASIKALFLNFLHLKQGSQLPARDSNPHHS
jgi:hypothetical protein